MNTSNNGRYNREQVNRFHFISAEEIKNLPPISWLVEGMLPAKSLSLVYGNFGSCKSFFALDIAFRVSMEKDAYVIYIAGEGIGGIKKRIVSWETHNEQTIGKVHFIGEPVPLTDRPTLLTFIEEVKEKVKENPILVVVDTLARCIGNSDENSTKDMGVFVESLDYIPKFGPN